MNKISTLSILAFVLLCSFAPSIVNAQANQTWYKQTTKDGVLGSAVVGLGYGTVYPYPLSRENALALCALNRPDVVYDVVTITEHTVTETPTSSSDWVKVVCDQSSNPGWSPSGADMQIVSRCGPGLDVVNGVSPDLGKTWFALHYYTGPDWGTARWCRSDCPLGQTLIKGSCQRTDNIGASCPSTKHPISIALGNKYLAETDYVGAGNFPLVFRRYYNSRAASGSYSAQWTRPWLHDYERRIQQVLDPSNAPVLVAARSDGRMIEFVVSGTSITAKYADTSDRLEKITDASGNLTGWRYRNASTDEIELYDQKGLLQTLTNRAGLVHSFTYSDNTTPSSVAPRAGLLIRVSDGFGRELNLTYDSGSRIATMTDPAGGQYVYSYNNADNPWLITSVTYPDNRSKAYVYNEASLVTGGGYGLTSVIGEDGLPYATYEYDSQGRAISEQIGGIADHATLSFGVNSTTVTDALNTPRTYTFQDILGVKRATGQSQPGGSGCGPSSQGTTYDANGNVTSRTDFNGVQTTYIYDLGRNLETSRIEAAGTPKARTITTQWHPTYRLPTQIDEPGKRTTYTHDAAGNVLSTTVLDTTTATSRTSTYTYNSLGQVLTVNGPRTDVNDTTTYTYYICTTGYQCGQVQTITDALNHVTTFNTYNAHGQPLTITDANNVVTTLTYDERQRLKSRAVAGETTNFFYFPTGLLQQVAMPDGSFLNYVYDAAHRLTEINDSQGNRMVYTLDAAGNRTAENVYDPSNALAQTRSHVFDSLGRLWKDLTASGSSAQTTIFGYDANGNATTVNAPLNRNSTSAYDELNRLKQVTDANNGITQYGYNALDQLISVTDPRNLQTTYAYNALGDLTQQVSPDTGTTINTFDSGGNLKTTKDARNKTATYTYDALNRVTQVVYPDQTITYTYDSGTNAVGKISSVTDSSGSTSWTYTPQGRIATKTQTMGAMVKTVQYGYNAAGQLTTITTPSSKTITYGYANNQVTNMMVNSVNLLNNVLYEPFGPTSGWTWGNGTLAVRTYDTDGKLTQLDSAGFKTIGYDDAFRITSVTDQDVSANSWSYGYDTLDRLTSAIGSQTQSFTFDANGNRLTQGGTSSSTLTVSPTNNRLSSVSGAITKSYLYDNAGNTTSDGTATYTYNDSGRMISVTKLGVTTTYTYNALGQRVTKSTAGTTTYFVYDEAGHILGEYDNSGSLIQETAWMYDTPVASIRFGSCGLAVFYIHTDHLNTPRRITKRSTNEIVWRWDSDAFGTTQANENPSGLGMFVFNLRFPGQYWDAETGLLYNWHRYYDPQSGRYITSDPIGLGGGINTYAYAAGNPLSVIDPTGLAGINEGFIQKLIDWISPKPLSRDECARLKQKIYDMNDDLEYEFAKYDPVKDATGGYPMRYGSGKTKPNGHYWEIRDLQRGLKNKLEEYNRRCRCDDNDDGNPPITRNVDELANKPVTRPPGMPTEPLGPVLPFGPFGPVAPSPVPVFGLP